MKILHALSQRPGKTGSGVTLRALVAAAHQHEQVVSCGVPHDASGDLDIASARVVPLLFETPELPFAVPGMSDVMPYRSTVFSAMSSDQVDVYCAAWRAHLTAILDEEAPDLIHTHHAFLMSAILCELARPRGIPVVIHSHATGLRQMHTCAHLIPRLIALKSAHVGLALHALHARDLERALEVPVHVVGAGFDEKIFFADDTPPTPDLVVFAGKIAKAKGVDILLEAWPEVLRARPAAELRLAGGGDSEESRALLEVIAQTPRARALGRLSQTALADELRRAAVFVLPSLSEGLPLVLVEAIACGARSVATELEGVKTLKERVLSDASALICTRDPPRPPALARDLLRALALGRVVDPLEQTAALRWSGVFARIENVWRAATFSRSGSRSL